MFICNHLHLFEWFISCHMAYVQAYRCTVVGFCSEVRGVQRWLSAHLGSFFCTKTQQMNAWQFLFRKQVVSLILMPSRLCTATLITLNHIVNKIYVSVFCLNNLLVPEELCPEEGKSCTLCNHCTLQDYGISPLPISHCSWLSATSSVFNLCLFGQNLPSW